MAMKKKYIYLMLMAAAVVASCAKENVASIEENSVSGLVFSSEKPAFSDETKTAWTGTSIQWSKGDKIRVAYTCDDVWQNADGTATANETYGKKTAKMYLSTGLPADSETAQFNVPTDFKGTASGTYKFYALYPDTCVPLDFKYAPSASVTIPTNQTPAADSFDLSADIMVGKSVETYTGLPTEAVSIMWNRLVAHTQFTFKAINGFTEGETIKSISLTANSDADMVGLHFVDVLTEVVTKPNSNTSANVLTISGDNLTAVSADGSYNVVAWASFLPCTVTSLNVVITTDKATYTREISGISLAFLRNARNTLTVNMSGAVREETIPTAQLVADGVYVIAYDNYMMTVGSSDSKIKYRGYATLSEVKDSEGSLLVDSEAAWEFTYDATSDTYSIKSMNEDLSAPYLKGIATNSDLTLVASDDKTDFAITESDDSYRIGITSGSNTRYIGYNTATNPKRFAMYAGTNSNQPVAISLYPARATTELAAPGNLEVEVIDGNNIMVSWNAVENANLYTVACTGKETVNTSDTSAEFTELEDGTYTITVTAVSNDSKVYRNSAPVSKAVVVGMPTLGTPVIKSFVQTAKGFSAEIESVVEHAASYGWELYSGSVETDNLVGTGKTAELKFSVDINEDDFLITEFTEGTVYYLVVVAQADGYKDASSEPANFTAAGSVVESKYYVRVSSDQTDWSGTYQLAHPTTAGSVYSVVESNWIKLGTKLSDYDNSLDRYISTATSDGCAIVIESVADGYVIKIGSSYVYCSAAKKVALHSTNKTVWTISVSNGFVTFKNSTVGTLYFNSTGLRPYASGNYSLPKLYKLSE